MLPRPYVGSYSSEKGHGFLHKPWILALAKSVETFILVSIYDMEKFGKEYEESKREYPKRMQNW